jgi:hypothetical protein
MEMNSKPVSETTETSPVYVNPDQKPNINNVRFRHFKVDIPVLIKHIIFFALFS